MATILEAYAPFDAGAGANVFEAVWRKFMKYPVATGVLANVLNQFEVYGDSSGRQVKIKTGECWIQGHWGTKTTETTLAIAANSSGSTRTDRVVLRADFNNNWIELDVLTGGGAVTQNTSIWEISLATVTVINGASTIAAGDVTDTRQRVGAAGGNIEYYQNVSQNITTGAPSAPDSGTNIQFDSSVRTSGDIAVSGTGNTIFTIKRAGTWAISATVNYNNGHAADYYAFIIDRSTFFRLASASVTSSSILTPVVNVSVTRHFDIGAAICIQGLQFSGVTKGTYRDNQCTKITMTWISDA
jgi:hypothetical protein